MMNSITEKLQRILNFDWKVVLLLFFVSLLFRAPSFFYSVIDHDESTYLIISDAINNGAYLYTDVIDTKPPGIFLIFSFVQLLFGKSVFAIRLFGSFVLSISAFLFFKIGKRLKIAPLLAFFSGLSYLLIFSAYRYGLAINTELFFSFFTLLGFYLFLIAFQDKKIGFWLLGGIAVGLGFITKYVVLAGFGAFSIFLLTESKSIKESVKLLPKLILAAIGLFLPFILIHLYFYWQGRFDDFYDLIYVVTGNYSSTLTFADALSFFSKFHLAYLPFLLLFYFGLFQPNIDIRIKRLSLFWYVFAWVMVILPGKPFKHYYLQLIPSLCFITPLAIEQLFNKKKLIPQLQVKLVSGMLALVFIVALINQSHFWVKLDTSRALAKELETKVDKNDIIIADEYLHLTYYLLNLDPPSKYVHPTIIFSHTKAFGVDTETEMNKMLDKKPKFIIYHRAAWYYENNERIKRDYRFYKQIGKAKILQLNS